MTPREEMLLELLSEVTRPSYRLEPAFGGMRVTDQRTMRLDNPAPSASVNLVQDRDYWRARCEETAKSLAEMHEELKRARQEERSEIAKFLRNLAHQCICRDCEHTRERQKAVEEFLKGNVVHLGGDIFKKQEPTP